MTNETQGRNAQGTQPSKLRGHRGSDPLWMVLLFGALLFISSMAEAAADMRGDQFITVMDGSTLSGTDSAGSTFNLYFLPGGHLTYAGRAGTSVYGTWNFDKDGDLCVRLPRHVDALKGCFAVAVDGAKVTWRAKHLSGSAQLRGSVVETFISPSQTGVPPVVDYR
jgi:hypothetical protein